MLSRRNILINKLRLRKYERCKYQAKSKQDFFDSLRSVRQKIEFAAVCSDLGLGRFPSESIHNFRVSLGQFQSDLGFVSCGFEADFSSFESSEDIVGRCLRSARDDIDFDFGLSFTSVDSELSLL